MEKLKISKIQNKEEIEVLSQHDCSTVDNPHGRIAGCDRDCTDPNRPAYYGSPAY